MEFFNFGTAVALVIGLTQWIKDKLLWTGPKAEVLSYIIGVAVGGAYQYVVTAPVDLPQWLQVVFVAGLMGLVPSGIFKFAAQMADKSKQTR